MSNIVKQELFTMTHDWEDVGNVQVPKGMLYVEQRGENPNGSEWDLGSPEAIHLDSLLLPPDELYLLNEVDTCYHAFSNTAHKFKLWWPNVELEAGEYKIELNLWGDYVGVGEDKPPVEDPEHTQVVVFFGEHNKAGKFVCGNCEDSVSHISTLEGGAYDIGFNVFVQWPQGSDAWANGMFIQSLTLTKLDVERYTVRVVKLGQESTIEATHDALNYVFEKKRTLAYSTDDCVHMMENELANESSYVEMIDTNLPSQQEAIATFEALGIKWATLHL